MRILIVAGARTGGTILTKWIASELNLPYVSEPEVGKNTQKFIEANCVTKVLISDWKDEWMNMGWNKIIGLWREDFKDAAISSLSAQITGIYHSIYNINEADIEKNNSKKLQKEIQNFIYLKENIQKMNLFNITYEGIYQNGKDIERLKKYLEIDKDFQYLHLLSPKNRYRNNTTKNII